MGCNGVRLYHLTHDGLTNYHNARTATVSDYVIRATKPMEREYVKIKALIAGLAALAVVLTAVVLNMAGANAAPAKPEQHPTPIPGAPHSLGTLNTAGLSMEADSVGFPKS